MHKERLSFQQIPTVNSSGKGNTPQKDKRRSHKRHNSKNILFSNMSDSDKTYDSTDLLLLQIKLLKRQNAFLKKKIQELNKQKKELLLEGFGLASSSKKPYPNKGPTKDNRDSVQISVEFFYREINNLINSVADAFSLHLQKKDQAEYQKIINSIKELKSLKSPILKKQTIHQKLQRIVLEVEHRRYPMLLSLFTDFYRVKTTADYDTAQYVDSLTDKALELNHWMLSKISQQNSNKKLRSNMCETEKYHHDEEFSSEMPQDQQSEKKSVNIQPKQKNPTFKALKSKY